MSSSSDKPKVVIYTIEVIGDVMAGPGIRALRMAEAISAVADVRLVSAVAADLIDDRFEVALGQGDALLAHIDWADVLVTQSPLMTLIPELQQSTTLIVSDLYDPFLFEELQQGVYLHSEQPDVDFTVRAINDMVQFADLVICASEKQRDLWLGQLAAMGRLNPQTYRDDPSLRALVDVVPFGVDQNPPVQKRHAIRGAVPGIGVDDTVLLWGGGLSDWFDPLTLIRAVGLLAQSRPALKLFFLATAHANPAVGTMKIAAEAQELAEELGVLGTSVFFNEQWVPHAERADWFLDADIGVSTHLDHLETAFSFRTRLLDYLWAGLPIVNTAGDAFEPVIRDRELGAVVPAGEVDALVAALDSLLGDSERMTAAATNARALASELSWASALAPLVAFCAAPRGAADDPRGAGARAPSGRAAQLERELAAVRSSSSWRITAPIRWLTDKLSGKRSS